MALEVRIRKKLNRFTLDMDFTAEAGVFALLGASGCGKSVTLKCIAGIERPDEGRIVLDGRVLFDSEKKINLPPQKRHVGYMFQDYALFPNMTVRQNIMTGMGKKPDQELVNSYLQRFQIAELAEEYPAKLSGGQKQRVAMARLVAQKPDVILLDEPFSALDTHLKWQLEKEMKEILNQVHKPTIFVSHSRDEVYHLCDTVCSINGGKAEVIEPVKAFFEQPKTRHAAILSGCKNVAAAERKDAHTCYVPAWGLTLHMEEEIPEDTAYVGIRAHEFREADGACAGEIQEAAGAC
ncbi:MAG: ATP-binding cassette domain-containing protein, partial [Lachnospiraceae bacterium]|nr:ATP-binding cassette domain-containing protein [Lachnospiraceae bacterium]